MCTKIFNISDIDQSPMNVVALYCDRQSLQSLAQVNKEHKAFIEGFFRETIRWFTDPKYLWLLNRNPPRIVQQVANYIPYNPKGFLRRFSWFSEKEGQYVFKIVQQSYRLLRLRGDKEPRFSKELGNLKIEETHFEIREISALKQSLSPAERTIVYHLHTIEEICHTLLQQDFLSQPTLKKVLELIIKFDHGELLEQFLVSPHNQQPLAISTHDLKKLWRKCVLLGSKECLERLCHSSRKQELNLDDLERLSIRASHNLNWHCLAPIRSELRSRLIKTCIQDYARFLVELLCLKAICKTDRDFLIFLILIPEALRSKSFALTTLFCLMDCLEDKESIVPILGLLFLAEKTSLFAFSSLVGTPGWNTGKTVVWALSMMGTFDCLSRAFLACTSNYTPGVNHREQACRALASAFVVGCTLPYLKPF